MAQAARDLYARQNAILIGLRIREARKAIGLSQTEFGKRFGKALRSIQKYESGEIEPSAMRQTQRAHSKSFAVCSVSGLFHFGQIQTNLVKTYQLVFSQQ